MLTAVMLTNVRAAAVVLAAVLACPISAKTDMKGCVSSETVKYGGASLIWYVPDTGEICEFLDCGMFFFFSRSMTAPAPSAGCD
jgi:hypothetical protein